MICKRTLNNISLTTHKYKTNTSSCLKNKQQSSFISSKINSHFNNSKTFNTCFLTSNGHSLLYENNQFLNTIVPTQYSKENLSSPILHLQQQKRLISQNINNASSSGPEAPSRPGEETEESKNNKLRRRVLWQCRKRGWLEIDLLVGGYATQNIWKLPIEEVTNLQKLLDESDPDIFAWITQKSPPPPNLNSSVLQELIQYAKNNRSQLYENYEEKLDSITDPQD